MDIRKYFEKTAELCVLAALFIVPVIFFTRANDVFEINKMFALRFFSILAGIMWLLSVLKDRRISLKKTPFDFPLAGFLAVSLITTFITENIHVSIFGVYEDFEGIITVFNYFILFYIIANCMDSARSVRKMIVVIAVASCVTSAYGLAQNFGWDFIKWNPETYSPERFFSTLGNPNFLAAYLVEAIPLVFILFLLAERIRNSLAAAIILSVPAVIVLWLALIKSGFNPDLRLMFAAGAVFTGASLTAMSGREGVRRFIESNASRMFFIFVFLIAIIAQFLTKSRAGFASQLVIFYIVGSVVFIFAAAKITGRIYGNREMAGVSFSRKIWWALAAGVITLGVVLFFYPMVVSVLKISFGSGALRGFAGLAAVLAATALIYAALYAAMLMAKNAAGGSFAAIENNEVLKKNQWWFAGLAVLVAATLFIPFVRDAFGMLWARSKSLLSLEGVILTPRLYIWKSAVMMFKDNFLLGTGLDTFQVKFPYYRYPIYWQLEWNGTPEKTHNIYLQVLATQGIAGFSFFALLIVAFFKKTFNIIRDERDFSKKYIVFGVFLAVIAYFIQGFFNYTVVAYGMLFWAGLGIIAVMDNERKRYYVREFSGETREMLRALKFPIAALILTAGLLLQVFLCRYWIADLYFKIGNIAVANNRPEHSIPYYRKAVEYNPNREIYWVKYGIGYEKAMQAEKNTERRDHLIAAALSVHGKTVEMNPSNGYNYNNMARVHKFYGEVYGRVNPGLANRNFEEAIKYYNLAIERDPNNAYFGLDLATIYINQGRYEKALEICGKYSSLYPNFATPFSYMGYIYMLQGKDEIDKAKYYYEQALDDKYWHRDIMTQASTYSNLGIIYVNMGRKQEAISMFEKVAELRPDSLDSFLNLGRLYILTGEHEKARDAYQRALQLSPGDRRAVTALEQIEGQVKK